MEYMKKGRGIIKWMPFASLEKYFSGLTKLESSMLSVEDELLLTKLIKKNIHADSVDFTRSILCIDVKSFYASCELVLRNLDVYTTKLAVVGDSSNKGSIIMACSHALKLEHNVSNVLRYYDLEKTLKSKKDRTTIIADTRMGSYVNMSLNLSKILYSIFDKSDIYHYSIDELFIDYTSYCKYFNASPYVFSLALKEFIFIKTGLPLVIGIGENMVSAKYALDIYAKKTKDSIAYIDDNLYKNFCEIQDFEKLWGFGRKIAPRLKSLGFKCVGDIANCNVNTLVKEFGVVGYDYYNHVNLIDYSDWKEEKLDEVKFKIFEEKLAPKKKSIGQGQTLFRDYINKEVEQIIKDMLLVEVKKLVKENLICKSISLNIMFSKEEHEYSKGFSRSKTLEFHTNNYKDLKNEFICLFNKHYWRGTKVRQVSISLGKLAYNFDYMENKLFEVMNKFSNDNKSKITFASQLNKESTFFERESKIGGHKS